MDGFLEFYTESVADYLPEFYDFLKKQPDDVVVHFSNWFRVGFNKKPHHSDPIGVYTFPKNYVFTPEFKNNHAFFSMNNAFILKPKGGRILNLSTVSLPEVHQITKKMGLGVEVDDITTGHHSLRRGQAGKPGHSLWDAMERAMTNLGKSAKNVQWNKYFALAGFDVLVDDGDSIIHNNEPYQVVFLRPGTFEEITHFEHKADKIFNKLARRVIGLVSEQLFDSNPTMRVNKKPGYSKEVIIYCNGTYKGKPVLVWAKYYENERNSLDHPLSIRFNLASHLSNDSPYYDLNNEQNRISISFESNKDVNSQVEKVVKEFKSHLDKPDFFRESKDELVKSLVLSAGKILGFNNQPKQERPEEWNYDKYYKELEGTLSIRGYYRESKYSTGVEQGYILQMYFKWHPKEIVQMYSSQDAEMDTQTVELNPEKAARTLLMRTIDYWQKSQEQLYPVDKEDWSDWRSFEKRTTGLKWKKVIEFVKNKIS